jgi:hypothetical protein
LNFFKFTPLPPGHYYRFHHYKSVPNISQPPRRRKKILAAAAHDKRRRSPKLLAVLGIASVKFCLFCLQ